MHTHQRKPTTAQPETAQAAPEHARRRIDATRPPAWTGALMLRPKLTVNTPGDAFEQDADQAAERVMRMADPVVQRQVQDDDEELVRRKEMGTPGPSNAPDSVRTTLNRSGQPLDDNTRAFMEPRFGQDFSGVRVHTDPQSAQSAAEVSARAYTVGQDVVFGAGQYTPESHEGRSLIAHELAHTLQQGEALAPSGVLQRDVLPVQRFSPAPGLIVDRTGQSTSISGAMELYGPQATAARAASIQNSINTTWTHSFPDGYSITCNITVTYRGPGSTAGAATQIEADNISGPSHVSPGLSGRTMTLNATRPDAFTWVAAHEFGHILGLDDRYSEGIMSKISGSFGGSRTTTVNPGYEGNLMAVTGGALESKNARDLAEENEPSPYWINDDDQIRDWVNAHSMSDIGRLSTANKLRAIQVLMGGWISDDDVNAIVRICRSVTDSAQANAIRGGVDVLDMTDIGQRTRVRVAFSQMPR